MVASDTASLKSYWERFFRDADFIPKIREVEDIYPDVRSVKVSFNELDAFDPDFAYFVLDNPTPSISAFKDALSDVLKAKHGGYDISLSLVNVPKDVRVGIRNIRAEHLGKVISIEGLVKKATEIRPMMKLAAFECPTCLKITKIPQNGTLVNVPSNCIKDDNGGCGKPGLIYRPDLTIFNNVQKLEVQELPDSMKGGVQPETITVYCVDDLTGIANAGDRVVINGILRPTDVGNAPKKTIQDIQLDAISIEMEQKDFDEIEITKEDEAEIKKVCSDPNLIPNLVKSIAPTIHGYEVEKEAMALQLFGGVEKLLEDGTKIRGDIHMLLVGDPGVAKSQMLRYMSGMAPRGVYVSGKSTSAAGLIAAAVKDDFGEGRWTLEAGALVLADRGLATVDELDKMSEQDRSALHEAMEAQQVHVSKAGINATLQCRFSMLAACNPEYGRFDENNALSEQIDLPPSLLSRFDLTFAMTDKPNQERDSQITDHILSSHSRGEALMAGNQDVLEATKSLKPKYDRQFIRKLVAYSRRVYPVLTEEAKKTIKTRYLEIRKKGEGEDSSVPITARQLEAIVRLSEASARARLSPLVERVDADRAVRIIDYFLSRMANDGDIDAIEASFTRSKRGKLEAIISTLKASPNPMSKLELEEKLDGKAKPEEIEKLLEQLHNGGKITESKGKYAIV